jgi:hypothetical protein
MQRVYVYRVYEPLQSDDTGEEQEESLLSMGFVVAADQKEVSELLAEAEREWPENVRIVVSRWKGRSFLLNLVIPSSFGAPVEGEDDGDDVEGGDDGENGEKGEDTAVEESTAPEAEETDDGFEQDEPPAFVQAVFTLHPESVCEELSNLSGIPILSVDNDYPFFVYRKDEGGEDDSVALTRVDRDALLAGDWSLIPPEWNEIAVELGDYVPEVGVEMDTQILHRPPVS